MGLIQRVLHAIWVVSICLIVNNVQAQGWRKGEQQLKAEIVNPAIAQILVNKNIQGDIYLEKGFGYFYVTPEERYVFDSLAIPYSILISDLNAYYQGFWNPKTREVPVGYHSYNDIVALADSLVSAFPTICKKISYGTSSGGNQLFALKISEGVSLHHNRAQVMFDAGIHGNEFMGPEISILLARELCKGYGSNTTYTNFINNREIWFYLMVNPDGRISNSRYNGAGIDCNRNAGFMWDNQCNSGVVSSQPETKALYRCMLENPFAIHVSYHSGTTMISYPWSYRTDLSPDNDVMNTIGGMYVSNSGYTGMTYGSGANVLYQISGSTKDAGYGINGSVSETIELGEFQPAASEINAYVLKNKASMLKVIEYAGYGLTGSITDSVTGKPVFASVFVDSRYPCFTHPEAGDYHKYLLAGTYNMKVTAPGYETTYISNVVISNMDTTIVDVKLKPLALPRIAGKRVVMCQATGNATFNPYLNPAFISASIGNSDKEAYAIGKGGWVVVEMSDTLKDATGYDFKIIQKEGALAKSFSCYAGNTIYGPWTLMGNGTGTTAFDFSGKGISNAKYIKIQDDNDGDLNAVDSGFDLDAIESVESTTAIDTHDVSDLVIYPNPANELVNLRNIGMDARVVMLNAMGQVVYATTASDKLTISTLDMKEGIYYIRVNENAFKVVIAK